MTYTHIEYTPRSLRWIDRIYDSRIRMHKEEYMYILYLLLAANFAFGLGLIIGGIWVLLL